MLFRDIFVLYIQRQPQIDWFVPVVLMCANSVTLPPFYRCVLEWGALVKLSEVRVNAL